MTKKEDPIKEKNRIIIQAADDKLAKDIKTIKLDHQAGLSDYFIIMSGRNKNHTQAIADAIDQALSNAGTPAVRTEGMREGSWILLDCGETIVHIFTEEKREYYGLEELWAD